jgi:hypothetical protein
MGYVSTAYTNPGLGSTLAANNRLNTDNVFFFDGHGAPGEIAFSEGQDSPGHFRIYGRYAATLDTPTGCETNSTKYSFGTLGNVSEPD